MRPGGSSHRKRRGGKGSGTHAAARHLSGCRPLLEAEDRLATCGDRDVRRLAYGSPEAADAAVIARAAARSRRPDG